MANRDRNKKILLELVKQPDNSTCADCGAPEPDWASYSLGIFICLNCSGTHRNLSGVSKVKSIRLDFWDDELVEFMKASGNAVARARYERAVPLFYYRPLQSDCAVLREQWIRAKYERREFTGDEVTRQETYGSGSYEGVLWKKGKDNGQFLKRKFILSESDFTLKYYTKEESKGPKAIIYIKDLNATFQPDKIGHAHGLQLTYLQDEHTRNIFVYHNDAQEIVNWFNAIRASRFSYLKMAFPTTSSSELLPWVTRSFLKEGYMEKTGPMDALELGAVFLGTEQHGYGVQQTQPRGARGNKWKHGIAVETPDRQFLFMCENERDQREWLEALRQVIARPMLPQDYTTEANVRRRR
ncbi:arf-GAP with dual PH domain-containing protein 1 isoform X2 [Lepisosteus oculatus]|uniref:arf-GAP with dual PH domain-containing protein 1 isoform X2 n=1 Tax=Lepisosteus oculatus TaxID=7918 RepID=UPI00371F9834